MAGRVFTAWCIGPQLCDAALCILRHCYNISASEKHQPGFVKIGHSNHYKLDTIQQLSLSLFKKPILSWWRQLNHSKLTDESFGIVPLVLKQDQELVMPDKQFPKQMDYLRLTPEAECPEHYQLCK